MDSTQTEVSLFSQSTHELGQIGKVSLYLMRKLSSGFPIRSDTNRAVRGKKLTRGLKVFILEVECLYCLCKENKGADQLASSVQLICNFYLHMYAKSR